MTMLNFNDNLLLCAAYTSMSCLYTIRYSALFHLLLIKLIFRSSEQFKSILTFTVFETRFILNVFLENVLYYLAVG